MSLDTSKLNLQGVGVLSTNATMISGVNPSARFNVTIKADDENHNFTSSTAVLENVTSISGISTFKITSNSGYQVNSSMFTSTRSSTYYSNVTFSNTINNLDPLNEVLVTVEWITQSITEDINIIIHDVLLQEIEDGNVYHRLNVNIVDSSFVNHTLISSSDLFNPVSNTHWTGQLQTGEEKYIGYVYLEIKDEYANNKVFSEDPNITINFGSDLTPEDYEISIAERDFNSLKVVIRIHPPLQHMNLLLMPDSIDIQPIIDTPSIAASPDSFVELPYVFKAGGLQTVNIDTYLCNLVSYKAIECDENGVVSASSSNAAWITFSDHQFGGDTFEFNVSENGSLVDRHAQILLYNVASTSGSELESIFVHQGEEEILIITHSEGAGSSLLNSNLATTSGLSLSNITRSGGTISYNAEINPNYSWPTTEAEMNQYVIVTDNNSGQAANWVSDGISFDYYSNNAYPERVIIRFNIPAQPSASPARSSEITVTRPGSTVSKTFTLSQRKGFDVNTDIPTFSIASNYGEYQVISESLYTFSNKSVTINIRLQLQQNDIDAGVSVLDFNGNVSISAGASWAQLTSILNASEDTSIGSFDIILSQNNTDHERWFTLNIDHPESQEVLNISIFQNPQPVAYWNTDILQINNSGQVTASFENIGNNGQAPVIVLAGIKEFSFPVADNQPNWTAVPSLDLSNNDYINGYYSDGITSAATVTMAAGNASYGSATFDLLLDFSLSDNPNNHDYRFYFYKIFPTGTVVDGVYAPINPSDGLKVWPTAEEVELPEGESRLLLIKQDIVVTELFVSVVGLFLGKYPFNLNEVTPNSNMGSFAPLMHIESDAPYSVFSPQYSGLNVTGNEYDPSTGLMPLDNSANIIIDLSKQTQFLPLSNNVANYNHTERSMILCLHFDLGEFYASNPLANNEIIQIGNPDRILYKVYFADGTNFSINPSVMAASIGDPNYIGSNTIITPDYTFSTIGDSDFEPNYDIWQLQKYIKIDNWPVPSTYTVGSTTKDVDYIEFYSYFVMDDVTYNITLRKPQVNYVGDNEDFAVFLLCGERNMIGMTGSVKTYPEDIWQYKSSTYIADNNDTTVHQVTNSPLDHQAGETGNTHGIPYELAEKFRSVGRYAGRKILFIPAGYLDEGFTSAAGKWKVGNQAYNHAVGAANTVLNHYTDATFEGVIWTGGETDYQNNLYAEEFFKTIQRMRSDIQKATQETPFMYSQPGFNGPNHNAWMESVFTAFEDIFYKSNGINNALNSTTFNYNDADKINTAVTIDNSINNFTNYPSPTIFMEVDKDWYFGLNNQMLLCNTNDESNYVMEPVADNGSGVNYNTFDYTNGPSILDYSKYSTVLLPGTYGTTPVDGINTRLNETLDMTIGVVFKYTSGEFKSIAASTPNSSSWYGFELYQDPSLGIRLIMRGDTINFPQSNITLDTQQGNGSVLSSTLSHLGTASNPYIIFTIHTPAELTSGEFIFLGLSLSGNEIRVYSNKAHTFTTPKVKVQYNRVLQAAATDGGAVKRKIRLGANAFIPSNIGTLELAYFSYLEDNCNDEVNVKWFKDLRVRLSGRNISI